MSSTFTYWKVKQEPKEVKTIPENHFALLVECTMDEQTLFLFS